MRSLQSKLTNMEVDKMQETQQLITKDMTIGEVVSKHPQVIDTLLSYGLHCVGCHINTMETLEEGSMGHGMPKEIFKEMLEKVNEVAINEPNPYNTGKDIDGEIVLTENAIKKIKELITQEEKAEGLRFGVVPGGCSGFSYDLTFDEQRENDKVMEYNGLKVFIDKDHLEMLNGIKIDYLETLSESGFKISNPNAKSSCGCGHSFS
ncbi:iron-sulfur cluster assembly accessory protein [Candidatus Woesearchaeota archaeon]|nr:iron-sulfur cluster assembly accessory protein [Candidatus Woesearchaeota archaeon]